MILNEIFNFSDWSGFWIDPNGKLVPVHPGKNFHHWQAVYHEFSFLLDGSFYDDSGYITQDGVDVVIDAALDAGWIRVYDRPPELGIEFTKPSKKAKRELRAHLERFKDRDSIIVNDRFVKNIKIVYNIIKENVIDFSKYQTKKTPKKNDIKDIAYDIHNSFQKQDEIEQYIKNEVKKIEKNNKANSLVSTPSLRRFYKKGVSDIDCLVYTLPGIGQEAETKEEQLAIQLTKKYKHEILSSLNNEISELKELYKIADTSIVPMYPRRIIDSRIGSINFLITSIKRVR